MFSVLILLTGSVLFYLAWDIYTGHKNNRIQLNKELKIDELKYDIIYLDEVLTMSARMGAATGNSKWNDGEGIQHIV